MTLQLAPGLLISFLLALVRASTWLSISPPFNTRTLNVRVRVGLAAGLAMFVAPNLAPATAASASQLPVSTVAFIGSVVLQAFTGMVLGFLTLFMVAAVQAAGALIDITGGFTISTAYDPLLNNQTSVIGRFYNLLAVTLLFATNAYLLLIKGFLTSFEAVPLSSSSLTALAKLLVNDLGTFLVSAVEIAGPMVAVLFLAEVVLGLLARAAPQMNIFALGFPLKILLVLLLLGSMLPLLPNALSNLIEHALREGNTLLRSATG